MKRREFIKSSLITAGSALLAASIFNDNVSVAQADTRPMAAKETDLVELYVKNRAPLVPSAFVKLPVGAIKPKGWLAGQLDLEINGLCGKYPEVSDYLKYDGNGWVDPSSDTGWEEVTYWLRGLTPLGYVTGDAATIALAEKWITGIIASQRPDGWFGPNSARTGNGGTPDMWPHMPVLYAIRTYYEATGDPKVIPFLTNYFKFQSVQTPATFTKSWAGFRWGDNIDSIYWLYNRTGDAFLLDLVSLIHANSADWTGGIASLHNVNFAQGFREPAQYGILAKDPKFLAASEANYNNMMARFGQMAGGGFAGDENARDGYSDPRQGLETCGIAEYMLSFEILNRITGNPLWADRCEEITFNMLPAAFDIQQRSTHYITSMNSIQLDNVVKTHGQFDNNFAMQAYMPGVHNYRCCPHNYGMAWPMYVENLWHATLDNGLAANLYCASTVTARVGASSQVVIDQTTDYPFDEKISMTLKVDKATRFPLHLRIPRWAAGAEVRVNGHRHQGAVDPLTYVVLDREWKTGDTVELDFPMNVAVRTWTTNKNSVSVDRGPLTYSLAINENWVRFDGDDQWPRYSVYPSSPWNYGLPQTVAENPTQITVEKKPSGLTGNPFDPDFVPIVLRTQAQKIDNWKADDENVITVLQPSPVVSTEPAELVTLIPMGAARLRITSFPTVGDGPTATEWQQPENS